MVWGEHTSCEIPKWNSKGRTLNMEGKTQRGTLTPRKFLEPWTLGNLSTERQNSLPFFLPRLGGPKSLFNLKAPRVTELRVLYPACASLNPFLNNLLSKRPLFLGTNHPNSPGAILITHPQFPKSWKFSLGNKKEKWVNPLKIK